MRKKSIKRGVALGLAMMLAMPVQPAYAELSDDAIAAESQQEDQEQDQETAKDAAEKDSEKDSENDAGEDKAEDTSQEEESKDEDSKDKESKDEASSEDTSESKEDENESDSKSDQETDQKDKTDSDQESGQDSDKKSVEASDNSSQKDSAANSEKGSDKAETTKDNSEEEVEEEELLDDVELATASNADLLYDEVIYNTGDYEVHVVEPDVFEESVGDACFEMDGSYTIAIPETNPFFPYEVQFTHDGEKEEAWFMDPEDSVEVDGHMFYVSAYFDDSAITQMNLEIAGEIVPVYPEKKKFKNDESGVMPLSLLPLEERNLTIDLSGYSPLELSMVKMDSVFTGSNQLKDTDSLMWKSRTSDNYSIKSQNGYLDFAYNTSSSRADYEIIVGKADQLEASNIRYKIQVQMTPSNDWISSQVYRTLKNSQNEESVKVSETRYSDYALRRRLRIYMMENPRDKDYQFRYDLNFDCSDFYNTKIDHIVIDDVYSGFMEQSTVSVSYEDTRPNGNTITIQAFDVSGQLIGEIPVYFATYRELDDVYGTLYDVSSGADVEYDTDYDFEENTDADVTIVTLKNGYAADDTYRLVMNYDKVDPSSPSVVLGAYAGYYSSMSEADAAGAENLKDKLFQRGAGYLADFSKGVYFTVFTGTTLGKDEKTWQFKYITQGGMYIPDGSADIAFYGLKDKNGNDIPCTVIDPKEDSYADYTYLTILVENGTDLKEIAPVFMLCNGKTALYAEGGNTPEVSGKSLHDFSKGAVQYTASAENKKNARNYWVQIIKPNGKGLYLNSLIDPDAETTKKNGVIYSKREMMIDERHDDTHDLLFINMGTEDLKNITVEVDSDIVELDDYWTFTGENDLKGFTGLADTNGYASNFAKIRLFLSDPDYAGEITGALTIKADGKEIMVLTLAGIAGDPSITTKRLPNAVKYVHYGTMIQNSNKYNFNQVSYKLTSGKLPDGVQLMPNGELYGVPTEAGTFTFTVQMKNTVNSFTSSNTTLTLTVEENSDANVEAATDPQYRLKERVPDIIHYNDNQDYTMTSIGAFSEWVNLYLDGKKLTEGVDFEAESGSTRLTIRSQTLKADGVNGTHTLSAEFRETGTNSLKRAAQNYRLTGGHSGNNGSNSSYSSSDKDNDSSSSKSGIYWDPKRGYMSAQQGIITGSTAGYSSWTQTETGWKLTYADGTTAAGHTVQQEDGTTVDQILWEKINGSWYAFNPNGALATGWVYDYQLANWYFVSERSGMISGWCDASPDGYTYYLDPATGALAYGWKKIGDKWYYLNDRVGEKTWIYQEETDTWVYQMTKAKPWGAMYKNEVTPDGYRVDENGAWDGNTAH